MLPLSTHLFSHWSIPLMLFHTLISLPWQGWGEGKTLPKNIWKEQLNVVSARKWKVRGEGTGEEGGRLLPPPHNPLTMPPPNSLPKEGSESTLHECDTIAFSLILHLLFVIYVAILLFAVVGPYLTFSILP
jgi:hypothetical protein